MTSSAGLFGVGQFLDRCFSSGPTGRFLEPGKTYETIFRTVKGHHRPSVRHREDTHVKTILAPLRALLGKAGRMAGFVVGDLNWSAPPWLRWTGGRARVLGRHIASHPRGWGLTVVTIATLTGGGLYGWKWWEAHKQRVVAYQEIQKVAVTWKVPSSAVATSR